MSLKVGIVGLPNAGKSTLFNALLKRRVAKVGKYPFTTVGKNIGVVSLLDKSLEQLADLVWKESGKRPEIVPATIKFVDIAGLVKGAHKGEGLGNEFLSFIREVDLICHVVRVFEDSNVVHVMGSVDPKRDIEIVETELILKDLETIEKVKNKKQKTKNRKFEEVIEKIEKGLNKGIKIKDLELSEEEREEIKSLFLLTSKPVVYVFNVSEAQISQLPIDSCQLPVAPKIVLCAKLEEELFELEEKEQREYLEAIGLLESGVDQLIKKCFNHLDLIVFYTIVGGKIVRAWPIKKGTKAIEAAAKIHSAMAKGFVKAEVVDFSTLLKIGSWQEAEKRGKVRVEGKDYVIKEKEVVEFKFIS